jgi:cytochrome P450
MQTIERAYDDLDISSFDFWTRTPRERDHIFRELRTERPISWHRPVEDGGGNRAATGGFWAVTSHRHVREAYLMTDVLLSGNGVFYEDVPEEANIGMSFIAMDAPRHTQLRRLVSQAFTARRITGLEDSARVHANAIIDRMIDEGPADFVTQAAAPMPTEVMADLIGIDSPSERTWFSAKADDFANWNEPEKLARYGVDHPGLVMVQTIIDMRAAFKELADDRRRHCRNDFISDLVEARVEGQSLTDDEIGNFLCLMVVAGTDTTKQTMSHAMHGLTAYPDARQALLHDFDGTIDSGVEEMVRYSSVGMGFRRTAARDLELGGQQILQGEKVVLFIISGNRDEQVFDDPWRFDVRRPNVNRHIAMGVGPHHCLGSALAKLELRVFFGELLARIPKIEAGDPVYAIGNHMHAVRTLPIHF